MVTKNDLSLGFVLKDHRPTMKTHALDSLSVDYTYQREIRPTSEGRIRRIADDFAPISAGFLTVNVRENGGGTYIMDGQHRMEAAQ